MSTPAVGFWHDDGVYLVNGKALASGEGYRTVSLPSQPAQTKYPILYPALLAVVWKLFPRFPQNVLYFKLLSLAGTILWCGALYRLIAHYRGEGRRTALWIAVLAAASPWTIWMTACTLPDSLFCFATTAAILLLTRSAAKPDRFFDDDLLIGGLFSGAAFLLRTAGFPLIASAAAVLLLRKKYRSGFVFLAIALGTMLPWLLWQHAQAPPLDAIDAYYSKASYVGGHVFSGFTAHQTSLMVLVNAALLILGWLPSGTPAETTMVIVAAITGTIAITGLVQDLKRGVTILNVWFCAYSVVVVCWLSISPRYAVPLVPFACLFGWRVVREDYRRSKRPSGRNAGAVFLVAFLILDASYVIPAARKTASTQVPTLAGVEAENWADTMQLADWLKRNSSRDCVVTGHLDPVLYLYAERRAVRPYASSFSRLFYNIPPGESPIGTADDLRANLLRHNVNYIVVTPAKWLLEARFFVPVLADVRRQHPSAFSLAYRLPDPDYFILEVHPEALRSASVDESFGLNARMRDHQFSKQSAANQRLRAQVAH